MCATRLLTRSARSQFVVSSLALLAGGVVVVDLLAKILARVTLGTKSVQLAHGVILRVFENYRGSFGLGPLWFTVIASIVVLALLFFFIKHPVLSSRKHTMLAVALLIGGGVANLGERLLFGRTTDLLVFWNLTALNLADVAILLGLALLILPVSKAEGRGD